MDLCTFLAREYGVGLPTKRRGKNLLLTVILQPLRRLPGAFGPTGALLQAVLAPQGYPTGDSPQLTELLGLAIGTRIA